MGFWLGMAVILLISLAAVSVAGRVLEVKRRLAMAVARRLAVSEKLEKVQTQVNFINAYQFGEAKTLSDEVQKKAAALHARYASNGARLKQFHGIGGLKIGLDAYVETSKILEEYESLDKEIAALHNQMAKLEAITQRAKQAVNPVASRWAEVRPKLAALVKAQVPAEWQKQWAKIDAALAQMSVLTDDSARDTKLASISQEVDAFEASLPQLRVWSEWNGQYESRKSIVAACIEHLKQLGLTECDTCKGLLSAVSQIELIEGKTPEEIVTARYEGACRFLGQPFTMLVSRASRLFALTDDKDKLKAAVAECYTTLSGTLDWWESPLATESYVAMQRHEPEFAVGFAMRRDKLIERTRKCLEERDLRLSSPVDALCYADQLLTISAQMESVQSELQNRWSAWKRESMALDARLKRMAAQLAEALEKLASANLLESTQASELTVLQHDIYEKQTHLDYGATDISTLETRLCEELRVADALVRAQTSVDTSLQHHLERLTRQHGDEVPVGLERQRHLGEQGLVRGDVSTAAWAALTLAENMFRTDAYENWNTW